MSRIIVILFCLSFVFSGNVTASLPTQELGNRVFISNLLDCPRAYELKDAEGHLVSEGVLPGYGYKGMPEKECSSNVPEWTHVLILTTGDYTLTIWCPKHTGEHKAETMKTYEITITKEQLHPPKGEGPLTLTIEKE